MNGLCECHIEVEEVSCVIFDSYFVHAVVSFSFFPFPSYCVVQSLDT